MATRTVSFKPSNSSKRLASKEPNIEFMSSVLTAPCPFSAAALPEGVAKTERGVRRRMAG
jgi:hypothetical protein